MAGAGCCRQRWQPGCFTMLAGTTAPSNSARQEEDAECRLGCINLNTSAANTPRTCSLGDPASAVVVTHVVRHAAWMHGQGGQPACLHCDRLRAPAMPSTRGFLAPDRALDNDLVAVRHWCVSVALKAQFECGRRHRSAHAHESNGLFVLPVPRYYVPRARVSCAPS